MNIACIFHVLIIFSLRFKSEFSSRISLQKSFSSFSSFSSFFSSVFQISVRFHDCRVRCELDTFTNKSSRLRILSIDKRKKKWINRFETRLKWFWCLQSIKKHRINFRFVTYSFSCWFLIVFFLIFYFDVIIFALFTVRIYDAWKIESCQNYFQRLLFDFIELRKNNKMHNNKMFETRMHIDWLTRFLTKFSIVY